VRLYLGGVTTVRGTQSVGLIGGLAVGATLHYYQAIVAACQLQTFSPSLIIAHADVNDVLKMMAAGKIEPLAQYLAGLIHGLEAAGMSHVAITPHICIERLLPKIRPPLINLLTETLQALRANHLQKVALFGTRFSIETRLFGGLEGIEVVSPTAEEIGYIHDTYLAIARRGGGTAQQLSGLSDLTNRLCDRERLDAIVLAGTDFSLIFNDANITFPALDCARVHIEAIVRVLAAPGVG
jgi:aspartate racemase